MSGSYQLNSFTANKEIEVKRLKSQVELFFDKEFEAYKKLGLRDGMKIIECGSGPGYLILNILKHFKKCQATALEIDPFLFEILSENSFSNGEKIYTPILGSIYKIDLPDNSVDFAVTRLVIEHLQNPYKAFSELYRILKPDGILVVVSNDFSYHVLTYPVIPELDEMFAAYNKSRFKEGGNPLIGRQLPVFIKNSGFRNINIELATAHSQLKGDQAMLDAENVNISRSLVKDGYLSEKTLENLLQKWYEMLNTPDHIIYRQLFIVGGIKNEESNIDFDSLQKEYQKSLNSSNEQKTVQSKSKGKNNIDYKQLESRIYAEWKNSLNSNDITVSDNFFDIGGHSVLIPEIIDSLSNQHGIEIKILEFFKYPTVKSLAEHIFTNYLSDNQEDKEKNTKNIKIDEYLPFKESIRKSSNRNSFASDDDQKAKLKAQRNKFKTRRNR